MAYEPTVWNTGDTITAEKLNKLENGVGSGSGGGGVHVVRFMGQSLDTPFATIAGYIDLGEIVMLLWNGLAYTVVSTTIDSVGGYTMVTFGRLDPSGPNIALIDVYQNGAAETRYVYLQTRSN